MQSLATRIDSPLIALSGRRLKKPINAAAHSGQSSRFAFFSYQQTVSICAETGFRRCRRSRNSASVGPSAIFLISASR